MFAETGGGGAVLGGWLPATELIMHSTRPPHTHKPNRYDNAPLALAKKIHPDTARILTFHALLGSRTSLVNEYDPTRMT